jgi:eukaryotic-like serine/threonine-protein kinase
MTTTTNVGVGDLVDGKYRLLRIIGEGGWGIVFEGENARTLKRVAIKILRARPDLTADIRTRFEREAQAAGRIGSDHIVEVFDLGTVADGSHYMVMELLSGEDLASRLRNQGALDATSAAKIVLQLLEGLAAAHEAGIMHRDLKPENLFLVPTRSGEDFVKILDFGISKFTTPGMTSATMTGAVLGSPFYMAPEQARGLKNVDPRTDLYSVGTLLFECVTGRVPFDGDNFNDLMFKIALAPRPNPLELRPDLDPGLVPIITKSIQADANERYETAELFRDALLGWLDSKGIHSIRSPELRRGMRTTPRTSGQIAAAATPTPGTPVPGTPTPSNKHQRPHWSGATAAIEGPTPISASTTVGRGDSQKTQTMVASAAIGALILAGAVAGAAAIRHRHAAALAAVPSAETSTMILDTTSAAPAVTPVAPDVPAPEMAELAPVEHESAADAHAAASAAPGALHNGARPIVPAPLHPAAPSKGTSPSPPEAAKSAEAKEVPPPPPPPAPPSPPKSVDNIEGRSIQTGL